MSYVSVILERLHQHLSWLASDERSVITYLIKGAFLLAGLFSMYVWGPGVLKGYGVPQEVIGVVSFSVAVIYVVIGVILNLSALVWFRSYFSRAFSGSSGGT